MLMKKAYQLADEDVEFIDEKLGKFWTPIRTKKG